jgi:hypothetical protein
MDNVTPNHKPEIFGEIIGEIGGLVDRSRLTLGILRRINALGAGLGFDIYANLEDDDG